MAIDLIQALTISASIWIFILLVLLSVWALQPPKKRSHEGREVRGDLKKIKDQINGEDD